MIGETYTVLDFKDKQEFLFLSEGPKGAILKAVVYQRMDENLYNLAFGDVGENDEINDSVVSNNKDLVKIMNTVAKTVYIFMDCYPERQIHIRPVDGKRSNLYHAIFQRKWDEMSVMFKLEGLTKKQTWEEFNSEKRYLAFKLTKK